MRRLIPLLPFLCIAAGAPLHAQSPISFEASLGGAHATGGFADPAEGLDAGPGYALGVEARVDVLSNLALYAGFERVGFRCGGCDEVGFDSTVIDSGVDVGAIYTVPGSIAGLDPWVRAAATGRELRLSAGDGAIASDPGFGYLLGAGVIYPLGPRLSLAPEVRYRSYSADFDFGEGPDGSVPDASADVSYAGVAVGLVYSF